MKKASVILSIILLACILAGCGVIKESVEVKYGDTFTITNEKLDKYDSLKWDSADKSVAAVDNGTITGLAPGSTVITVCSEDGKTLAEYSTTVVIVPVTSIVLSTNVCEMTEGDSFQLSYTLFPENASDYGLSWKSANDAVATVNQDGRIEAKAEGQTTISISNKDGFIATCSVEVKKALPNFKELYGQWANEKWFSVADDGSWMKFDTNPDDEDGDDLWLFLSDYLSVAKNLPTVLSDLGFASSVYEKMNNTTALMGKQEASSDVAIASWTYHPDNGLEVIIDIKK